MSATNQHAAPPAEPKKEDNLPKADEVITPSAEPKKETPAEPVNSQEDGDTSVATQELMTRDQVASIVNSAVESALNAQKESAAEQARIAAAAAEGNYQALYEDEVKKRRTAELNQMRGDALRKYNLSDDWFDSLVGDDKDKINASAKDLRKRLDKQIDDAKAMLLETHPPTPPAGGGAYKEKTQADEKSAQAKKNLAGAFGIKTLPSVSK